MATEFESNLFVLPAEQRLLWSELSPLPSSFVLCGGTAIAVQLGHRRSVDFGFISTEGFDPDELYSTTPFLENSFVLQKAPNTLTCAVDRGQRVQVSFFGVPALRLSRSPHIAQDNRIRVADLLDLAGMKAAVVQKRAEAKDYFDLDTLITQSDISLSMALAAARAMYGRAFNPELTLKALCFFDDGDLAGLSASIRNRLVAAVRAVDLKHLPAI